MKIVDLTAGNRAVWVNKAHPDCTYIDKRESVKPDIVADICDLRSVFEDSTFDLVVFDPPHINFGITSDMAKTYGHHTTKQIIELLQKGSAEARRISKPHALMAFKWNDHDIPLKKAIGLMVGWEALFGHVTKDGPGSKTYWVMLKKVTG